VSSEQVSNVTTGEAFLISWQISAACRCRGGAGIAFEFSRFGIAANHRTIAQATRSMSLWRMTGGVGCHGRCAVSLRQILIRIAASAGVGEE